MYLDNSVPLYYQIISKIKNDIEEGILKPGDRIDTEKNLCNEFGVSRVTVRKALDEMVAMDIIERRPNKGHFVKYIKTNTSNVYIRSLYNTILRNNHKPSSKIISVKVTICPDSLMKEFNCDEDKKLIIIERIRYADNNPLAFETVFLPFDIFENLDPFRLEKESLTDIIIKDYKIDIAYSIHTLEPKIPTDQQAKLLNVSSRYPQLGIKMSVISTKNIVIKYAKIIYLTGVIDYSFTWNA